MFTNHIAACPPLRLEYLIAKMTFLYKHTSRSQVLHPPVCRHCLLLPNAIPARIETALWWKLLPVVGVWPINLWWIHGSLGGNGIDTMVDHFQVLSPLLKWLCRLQSSSSIPGPEYACGQEHVNLVDEVSLVNCLERLKVLSCTAHCVCEGIVGIRHDDHSAAELGANFKCRRSTGDIRDIYFIIAFIICWG